MLYMGSWLKRQRHWSPGKRMVAPLVKCFCLELPLNGPHDHRTPRILQWPKRIATRFVFMHMRLSSVSGVDNNVTHNDDDGIETPTLDVCFASKVELIRPKIAIALARNAGLFNGIPNAVIGRIDTTPYARI